MLTKVMKMKVMQTKVMLKCTECLDDLSEHIVKAAWRRNGYSYFPQEQVQVQLTIEQDAQLDDEVDISSLDETVTDTTSEAPNNNNE